MSLISVTGTSAPLGLVPFVPEFIVPLGVVPFTRVIVHVLEPGAQ